MIRNLWPDKFEAEKLLNPREFLSKQAELLAEMTRGTVRAEVVPMGVMGSTFMGFDNNNFNFSFNIVGPFIDNYTFTAIDLSHNIDIYPISIHVEESIAKEMGLNVKFQKISYLAENNQSFEIFIEAVFHTKKIRGVIESIMSLSMMRGVDVPFSTP